jgi:hypothetical protein
MRRGATGSFGAPLEKIVASFPAEGGHRFRNDHKEEPVTQAPRLAIEDVGASIRAAFALIDRIGARERS